MILLLFQADLVEAIAGLVEDHKIDGISDVRDESDREGIRVVVDVKRGTEAQIVLNNLYKRTKLQSSFSCNMVRFSALAFCCYMLCNYVSIQICQLKKF